MSSSAAKGHLVHASGSSMDEVVRTCGRVAPSDATVLVTGETGTGKEMFARLIHERSARSSKPFVPVNCGAIPETLLESELFGYVRGAFTGAVASRKGRVALAEGGTLFLDEIGELPLSLQVKLLRLLQERSYEPVGSNESVSANFRLIAATNRDLAAEVEAGRFRRDLYYRLLVCPIELPALRNRQGDVTFLFRHFWTARGEARPVDDAVISCLESYGWPGNVRELENLVERLSVCAEGARIAVADLPPAIRGDRVAAAAAPRPPPAAPEPRELFGEEPTPRLPEISEGGSVLAFPINLTAMLRTLEDAYIDAAIQRAQGNKKAAADMLGLQRTTLVEKLRRRTRDSSTVAMASP